MIIETGLPHFGQGLTDNTKDCQSNNDTADDVVGIPHYSWLVEVFLKLRPQKL